MRAVIQCVKSSSVYDVDTKQKNEIGKGYNILVGFTHGDTKEVVDYIAKKIVNLRVFVDENNKMNLSVKDVNGEILSISQFTLYADSRKGNRPGFTNAMDPVEATKLYDYFNEQLASYEIEVKSGFFGADMIVNIENDGPTTIIFDSEELIKK